MCGPSGKRARVEISHEEFLATAETNPPIEASPPLRTAAERRLAHVERHRANALALHGQTLAHRAERLERRSRLKRLQPSHEVEVD